MSNPTQAATYAAIADTLTTARSALVVTHVDPDGDAFGSLTAVGQALGQLGIEATLAVDGGMVERFRYLPLSADVVSNVPDLRYDVLIVVDCGDELRPGQTTAGLNVPPGAIVNIDHHVTNTYFGTHNLVDPTASSTVEMLLDLFQALDVTITPGIAESLLTGLVTDTMSFRTSNVTQRTLAAAATLVAAGADLYAVTERALLLKPYSTLQLWRQGLVKVRLEKGVIWTALTHAEQRDLNHTNGGSAGLVSFMAEVVDASISVVLMERHDGRVTVSFRSREPIDVSTIAVALGGGGHKLASGCTVSMPLPDAERLVIGRAQQSLAEQRAARFA